MDTVVWILMNNKAYIGDIYKGKIKQVVFKKMDYWEIYHHHDMHDLIEYMNYPLNYNKFKNNTIKILYDNPKMYDYLYKVASDFNACDGITIGRVEPIILGALLTKEDGLQFPVQVSFMERTYKIQPSDDMSWITKVPDEEVEEDAIKLSVVDISAIFMMEANEVYKRLKQYGLKEESIKMIVSCITKTITTDEILDHYLVFSPVTLYENRIEGKKKVLKVEDIVIKAYKPESMTKVNAEDTVLTYEHKVYKWFGKAKAQPIALTTPITGTLFMLKKHNCDTVWAKRNDLIGVVSQSETTLESVENWLEKTMWY